MSTRLPFAAWAKPLRWIDRRPLLTVLEPYRLDFLSAFLDSDCYHVGLTGRGKKNWKSADLCLAVLRALCEDWPAGSQCYLLANDQDQARDDLVLLKKILSANPVLAERMRVKQNVVERKDGRGFAEVLPAQDVAGAHGKTFRLVAFDEIHAYRDWDLLEALSFDPSRPETQWMIASYASMYEKPGAPLYDLLQMAKAGTNARLLCSWYSATWTTDAAARALAPEDRANPSRGSWKNPKYLEQQRALLPWHKFRRLHLNLGGLPEGSAFKPEPIAEAIDRGVLVRAPEAGVSYAAFVDMSGGSNDDAVLAIAHRDGAGRAVLDRVLNQGPPPPFDPNACIPRFVAVLADYRIARVTGDQYAGRVFLSAFEAAGVTYAVSDQTKHELYEAFEPHLNGGKVVLLDVPLVEQQLLGLVWRGKKIDHPTSEHDDWSNAVAGAVVHVLRGVRTLEIWGGNMDASDEDPQAAHDREQREAAAQSAREIADACASSGYWWPGGGR